MPIGFVFVDVNEHNFRNYMSKIQHLLTEEIGEKLPLGLVGFVKSVPRKESRKSLQPPVYKIITRASVDEEFDVPPGFELISGELFHADDALAFEEIREEGDMEKFDQGLAALVKFSMMDIDMNSDDKNDGEENDVVPGACVDTEFQCCSDLVHPQHGYQGYGCCAASEFGCCPDNITPAPGPFYEVIIIVEIILVYVLQHFMLKGCDCTTTEHGCCPDGLTPARGPDHAGCGCQYSEHGCCPDQLTPALGPGHQGCQCHTFTHGCCPDNSTPAQYEDEEQYI